MKTIYENFYEIAQAFNDGYSWPHRLSDHNSAECIGWQSGVFEFAEFLDSANVKLVQNPEIYNALWDKIRTLKRDSTRRKILFEAVEMIENIPDEKLGGWNVNKKARDKIAELLREKAEE